MATIRTQGIDLKKTVFQVGQELFTVHDKQIIPFYVDYISVECNTKIVDYCCKTKKHDLPLSNNFGKIRKRQNHNLFLTQEDAESYLKKFYKVTKGCKNEKD